MRAVTFQAPARSRVDDEPEPELQAPTTRSSASRRPASAARTCTSTTAASRSSPVHDRTRVRRRRSSPPATRSPASPSATACSAASRSPAARASSAATATSTSATARAPSATARRSATLQGTQAEQALVPHANLTLRRVPDGARDGRRAVRRRRHGHRLPRRRRRRRPPGRHASPCSASARSACAPCRRHASPARRRSSRSTPSPTAWRWRAAFGAQPVHLTEEDPRAAVKALTGGRGVDVAVEAVGDPRALELAIRLTRKCGTVCVIGVYAERSRSTWACSGSRR